jgi:hypothetical protein
MKIRSLFGNLTKRFSKNASGMRPSLSQFNFSILQNNKASHQNSLFHSTKTNPKSNVLLRSILHREYTDKRNEKPYDQSKHKKKALSDRRLRVVLLMPMVSKGGRGSTGYVIIMGS